MKRYSMFVILVIAALSCSLCKGITVGRAKPTTPVSNPVVSNPPPPQVEPKKEILVQGQISSVTPGYTNAVMKGVTNVVLLMKVTCSFATSLERTTPPSITGSYVVQHPDTSRDTGSFVAEPWMPVEGSDPEVDAKVIPKTKTITATGLQVLNKGMKIPIKTTDKVVKFSFNMVWQGHTLDAYDSGQLK